MMLRGFPQFSAPDAADHAAELANYETPLGDYLAAKFGEGVWSTTLGQAAAQLRGSTAADTVEILRQAAERDPRTAHIETAPAPRADLLDEESWKASPWHREGLRWDPRMSETRARALAEIHDENAARRYAIEQSPTGGRSVLGFGAELAAGLTEPLNFIPFAGPAARAAAIARYGGIGGRALVQAGEAAAGTALAQPLVLPSQREFGDDVGYADAAANIAFGALFGAAFGAGHGGWRAWADRGAVHSVPAQAQAGEALSRAALDLAQGRAPQLQLELEQIRTAMRQAEGELAALRGDPTLQPGEPLEALARLAPETGPLREVLLARGRAVRMGEEIAVPGRDNLGLFKILVKHQEVTDDDLLRLPQILRERPPVETPETGRNAAWVWRVMDDSGTRQITYVVKPLTAKDGRNHLVSVYASTDPARFRPSSAGDGGFGGNRFGEKADAAASPAGLHSRDTAPGIPGLLAGRAASTGPIIASIPDVAITPAGRRVGVAYQLVELDSLIASQGNDLAPNPQFPAELQPRKRDRAAAAAQVAEIAGKLDPDLLGRSTTAGDGAPIVGPDNVVESGNGRTLALRRAYGQDMPSAARYRSWLVAQGYADAAAMQHPVLIRRRLDALEAEDRVAFTREANDRTALAMGAAERAGADARAMPDALIDLHRGGEIASAANREFVAGFLELLPVSERGGMVDAKGRLSQEGQRRIEAAMLARAYEDPGLVGRLLESTDDNAKAIGGALLDIAPDWIRLRQLVRDGDVPPDMDQTEALLRALGIVRQARESGQSVRVLADQLDLFHPQAAETRAFLEMMYGPELKRAVGRDRLAESLGRYAEQARLNLAGARLFGEALSAIEILRSGAPKAIDPTPLPEPELPPVDARQGAGVAASTLDAAAREHGVDLQGGYDEAAAFGPLEAEGRLRPEDANRVRSAEALAAVADDEAAGLEAAAACLLRRAA